MESPTESKNPISEPFGAGITDWNEQRFGLAEYSDTVGPPGERFFVIINTRKLSLYDFRA